MRFAILACVAAFLALASEGKSYSKSSYSKSSYSYKPSYKPSTSYNVYVAPSIGLGSYYGGYNNNYGYNYGYNNYNSYSVTYTGMALGQMTDGTYGMIPTSQCPFSCSVNGVCGTESQCDIASIVMYVVLGIFGFIFLTVICIIVCCCCRAAVKGAQHASRDRSDSHCSDDFNKVTEAPTVTATYYNPTAVAPQYAMP